MGHESHTIQVGFELVHMNLQHQRYQTIQEKKYFGELHKPAPILYEDYAWEKYMVEPGDFLVKIAKKEYGDFKLWKYIYEWNKEQIGDNPNVIYPYNFFDLQKERLKAKTADPSFFDYVVQPGDNLWNISGRQYGDAKSWIILLRDNEDIIKASAGILNPGMVIKLREKLDPNS